MCSRRAATPYPLSSQYPPNLQFGLIRQLSPDGVKYALGSSHPIGSCCWHTDAAIILDIPLRSASRCSLMLNPIIPCQSMPATTSYRLRRCKIDMIANLDLTSPLFITRGMYVFFQPRSLVSGYNADSMEYHVPSLDDDKPHKSFSWHVGWINPSGHGLYPPDTSEWKKTSAPQCVIEQWTEIWRDSDLWYFLLCVVLASRQYFNAFNFD